MKCISCTHAISIELSFAFNVNQCPKCGLQLMEEEVKPLFIEMKHFTEQGNDLGDLAKFLYHKFGNLDLAEDVKKEEEPYFDSDLELLGPMAAKPKQTKIKPISHPKGTGGAEGSLLSPERLSYFNKHAKIDDMNKIVKEIQGKKDNAEYLQIQDIDSDEGDWDPNLPLTPEELMFVSNEVSNLQETPDPNENEMAALRKFNRR